MTESQGDGASKERLGRFQKGRYALLWAAALMLALGTALTALWRHFDFSNLPVLYIVLPVTFVIYNIMLYLG